MEKSREAATNMDYASDTQSTCTMPADLPPPAYRQPLSSNLKLARIGAATLVAMTLIVGIIVLMGVYIQTIKHCSCKGHEILPRAHALYGNERLDAQASNEAPPGKAPVPLNLLFEGDAGKMIKNNQKTNLNCMVERRRATQIVEQQPKMLMTPFGNVTTDPKLIHMVGERMVFSCNSGSKKSEKPSIPGKLNFRPKRETAEGQCGCSCNC